MATVLGSGGSSPSPDEEARLEGRGWGGLRRISARIAGLAGKIATSTFKRRWHNSTVMRINGASTMTLV